MSKWDDEETTGRFGVSVNKKWDDEDDEEVLDSWDAADDSEEERAKAEKAQKAAEAAAAAKKSKTQRIAERQAEHAADKAAEEERLAELENETPEERRKRLQDQEIEADLGHAVDLFGGATVEDRADHGVSTKAAASPSPSSTAAGAAAKDGDIKRKAISVADPADKSKSIDLSTLPLFNPTTKKQFQDLQEILAPLLSANVKKAQYPMFVQELTRLLIKDMSSEHIRRVASTCTTLTNEKLREEKAAEKGTKKTKAQKTKTTLVGVGGKDSDKIDTGAYDDFGDEDFM